MPFPKGLLSLSKLISLHGIEEAIVCPGSRNAPIILALKRNPSLKLYSIIDERSAGFFALGRALTTKKPVVVCCTSGSAGLNLAPALSEAFYQEIPILAITADRPAEWIDQWDGQTIQQQSFLVTCVKKSLIFPNEASTQEILTWHQERVANEAILTLTENKNGPVHLNVPIAEPFYPTKDEQIEFPATCKKISIARFKQSNSTEIINFLKTTYQQEQRIILSIGQLEDTNNLQSYFKKLLEAGIVLIGDSTANASNYVIQNHDLILSNDNNWKKLKADLVIHIGKSHVSKRIKQFFRKEKPFQQWLVRNVDNSSIIDNFQSLTQIIPTSTDEFLASFVQFLSKISLSKDFSNDWNILNKNVSKRQHNFLLKNTEWNEMKAIQSVLSTLQLTTNYLHLGNSLSIRYSNWLPFFPKGLVYCNRGTSGIDGTVSTYIAATTHLNEISYLVLGDLSFQYDKNGLWNRYLSKHQRIIILNNSGGGIFRNLEGAKDLPELEDFIATAQENKAEYLAKSANLTYLSATNTQELLAHLHTLGKKSDTGIILEIFTDPIKNKEILAQYMALFKS